MHIQLTDLLTCPRCGPDFGLVVLSERMERRRVQEGSLGCPNCESRYPIDAALADLRVVEGAAPEAGEAPAPDPEAAVRLAALLGLDEPGGFSLLLGDPAGRAGEVASRVEGVQLVAAGAGGTASPRQPEVSRLLLPRDQLPFRSGSLRAIALGGALELLEEAARALRPGGRLLLEPAPADAERRLEAAGLRVLARDERGVLAERA